MSLNESSESGTGQVNQVIQELDRWIERVWNWTVGSSESGTGLVNRANLELDRWIE